MSKAKSFRTKLWLYFILFTAIVFSLLWVLQTVFLQTFYNTMLERNTRNAAEQIAADSRDRDFTTTIDELSADNSLLVFVTDTEGTILYSSDSYKSYYHSSDVNGGGNSNPYHQNETMDWQIGNYRNLPDGYGEFLDALKACENGKTEYKTDSQYIYGSYIETENGETAVLYVSAALGAVGATVSIIRIQLLWVTVLSLAIAFAIAWLLAKKFSVPVDQLSVQARMLAADSYEPLFEKGFCKELDALSDSLDDTASKLEEAKKYQKDLLANVSHDLRTPLTMIKGYAEMVRDVSWENEEQRTADTGVIIREADRLTALVNEILEYSSLQDSDRIKDFTDVDFGLLVKKVCDRFEPLFQKDGYTIERNIDAGCIVNGNAALLERAVYNLIDNASRHMGSSNKINVSVHSEETVLLTVTDYGEGIEEAELPHIWEKYYTSRQRGKKGVSGLGLAIVKQIAQIHGAEYGVESQKNKGCRFWIAFQKK